MWIIFKVFIKCYNIASGLHLGFLASKHVEF